MEGFKAFINGHIITCDSKDTIAQGMLVKDDRIIIVGSNDEIQRNPNISETVDLEGKTVIPGLIDSHVHMTQTGLNKLGVELNSATSLEEIFEGIKNTPLLKDDGNLVFGIGYDDSKIKERRPPTRWELDVLVPEKYLWLGRVDSHSCVVNTKMLYYLNLPEDIIGIDRDEKGKPTGVLRAEANSVARKKMLELIDDETRKKALRIAAKEALKKGVTTLNALEGGPLFNDRDFEIVYQYKDKLPIDIEIFFQTTDVEKAMEYGLKRIGGCIILDGSFGSRTAALFEPYQDDSSTRGVLYFTQEDLDELVVKAHKNGLQLAFHALGERAIEQVLNSYEKAIKLYPRMDHRHRIEHFELPSREQINKAVGLGIVLSLQPAFEHLWGGPGGMYEERLGSERIKRVKPCKEIIEAGGLIIGGSDSDVTPIDPMLGIHGAVNHSNPSQRIGVKEALKMFTINGAKGIFKEAQKGSIEEGKLADFVVLSHNPYSIDKERLKEIVVEKTYKNGELVYTIN